MHGHWTASISIVGEPIARVYPIPQAADIIQAAAWTVKKVTELTDHGYVIEYVFVEKV